MRYRHNFEPGSGFANYDRILVGSGKLTDTDVDSVRTGLA